MRYKGIVMIGSEPQAGRRRLPHLDAAKTFLLAPQGLMDGDIHVVRRNQPDTDEAVRRDIAVVRQPGVIAAKALAVRAWTSRSVAVKLATVATDCRRQQVRGRLV